MKFVLTLIYHHRHSLINIIAIFKVDFTVARRYVLLRLPFPLYLAGADFPVMSYFSHYNVYR